MDWIGIDGCRGGWVYIALGGGKWKAGAKSSIQELHELLLKAQLVLIDMPIGFPDTREPVRSCDRLARKILGKKASSIFPVPARETLNASNYEEGNRINRQILGRGLSRQSWGITPKLKELDEYLRSSGKTVNIREAHPEVLFWSLNHKQVFEANKKTNKGFVDRINLLQEFFLKDLEIHDFLLESYPRKEIAPDDVLDALVLAVSALMSKKGLISLPREKDYDLLGMPREIVYPNYYFPGPRKSV